MVKLGLKLIELQSNTTSFGVLFPDVLDELMRQNNLSVLDLKHKEEDMIMTEVMVSLAIFFHTVIILQLLRRQQERH